MRDIQLRTAEQLGAVIRLRRNEKKLSQVALAELLGVERKWVLRLEAGNPRAEIGLVLKVLNVLGIRPLLSNSDEAALRSGKSTAVRGSRLDEVFRRLESPVRK